MQDTQDLFTLRMLGMFSFFTSAVLVFSKTFFQQKYQSAKQVRVKIGSDVFSGLICVQTVCIDYQHTALPGKEFNCLHTVMHY